MTTPSCRRSALAGAAVALPLAACCCLSAGPAQHPLLPRTAGGTSKLFTVVAPEQTGIAALNSFEDPRCWGEFFREFNNGSLGTGVAIGDYDGDGRPDVVVSNKTGPIRLYRNLGSFQFEDVTASSGLLPSESAVSAAWGWLKAAVKADDAHAPAWGQGVVFADINNDGWLDISACRFGAPNLLFINHGDGTFTEEAAARGLAIADASVVTAFCDFDRDGWLDAFVQTNLLDDSVDSEGRQDYLFRNDGTGRFVDVSDRLSPRPKSQGHSCAWWDYDDDGWPDLYVANDFAAPDLLYRNNRDGSFTDVAAAALPHTPYSAMGCDTADVDNDGLVDLFVADMAVTSHEKDQRSMAIARYTSPTPKPGEVPQVSRNMLYLATGTRHTREGAFLAGVAASDWTWSPRFEDFNCDGRVDLLITNGMIREYHNIDLVERSGRAAAIDDRIAVVRGSPVLQEKNLAYRNDGDLRFTEVGAEWGFDELGVSFGSATGDLDGDGDLDLVTARLNQPPAVYRNDGKDGERVVFTLRGTKSNRFGIGARVDLETADGWQTRELWGARGYQSSSEPAVYFGFRTGTALRQVKVRWPSGTTERWPGLRPGFAFELVEGEGEAVDDERREDPPRFTELAVAPQPATTRRPGETAGVQRSPRLQPRSLGNLGPSIAVADLDHDGTEEVLIGGTAGTGIVRVLADMSQSPIQPPPDETRPSSPLDDGPMLVFDADGDGNLDLLLTKTGDSSAARPADFALRLWLGDGHGGFHASGSNRLPQEQISGGALAAADFDRDGQLEVFVGARVAPGRYPQSTGSLLLHQRGATWTDEGASFAPGLDRVGMVTSALCSDVDDDGWIDLIVATEWGGIRYFRNLEGSRLEEPHGHDFESAGTGWWTALAGADLNRDGQIDYIAGNAGLNSHYRATREHPAMLFELPTGRSRPVTGLLEAYFENGKRYPWRTRRDLASVWPALLKKYPTNNDYAPATIEDIFGESALAAGRMWTAEELRSGVFLSAPDRHRAFAALPQPAQIASIQGIAAGDMDADGMADVLVLHNSSDQVSGHWDGGVGLFLAGHGNGNLEPIDLRESGFCVPGEGRALALFDLGGPAGPGIAAARNRAAPLVFRNSVGLARDFLVLRLRQPGPNAEAVGARLAIGWSDGHTSAAEVYSGGGYLSQSSRAIFIGLGGAATPGRLRVRWPDGTSTEHSLAARGGTVWVDKVQGVVPGQ